ncbi:MAG: hypothetical protein JNK82_24255 [Myxococcaceae bacterium]|nr:hypothetical protein [Myxococcaceae bacterium]
MNVHLGGSRIRLNDTDLLGEGGEARVYRFGDQALKLFHTPTPQKAEKVLRFPQRLPAEVVAPREAVHDDRGTVIGYAMPAVLGHDELARLTNRRWREGVVSNARVLELFDQAAGVLKRLHAAGVVVGDLNDGNVLFEKGLAFIDADSMQFAGLPCVVGHEKTLDPALYGVDLTSGPRFTPGTDWYAWHVLLFSSLLYVHPFGGVHPKLPTLLRRAQAGHSVLESDVLFPKSAVHWRVLPDEVLHHFTRVFKHGERGAPPPLPMGWAKCSCGLEHARAACPDCQTRGPAAARQALRNHGRCRALSVFSTAGRVLEASLHGGLRYVYEENGVVRREDGALVLDGVASAGTRFVISGGSTWVADRRGQVVRMQSGRVAERASTGLRQSTPVLTDRYRLEQEWIVDHTSGARVGQILEGQTWLWSGARLGLGLYRAGDVAHVFLVHAGKAGLTPVRHVPGGRGPVVELRGRLVEAACVFDDGHALLSAVTEHDGRESHELWLFNAAGQRLATGAARSRHHALLAGRVVCATDAGLMSLKLDGGVLVEGTLFTDTEPFVSAGDELLPQPDGSLLVVGTKEILQLSLS